MSAQIVVLPVKGAQLQAGDFVMLHPGSRQTAPLRPHPDAGRIGRIERLDDFNVWVCFRDHAEQSGRTHCILPRAAWVAVERGLVEARRDDIGAITWSMAGTAGRGNRERAIDGRG